MGGGGLGDILPLAIGIAISPVPIIACILMLFSARASANGSAFLGGWVVGIAVATLVFYAVSDASSAASDGDPSTFADVVRLLLGLGALALAVRQWSQRPRAGEEAPMPGWMASIESIGPLTAAGFGVLLSAVNPKNLGLAAAAGVAVKQASSGGSNAALLIVIFVMISASSIVIPVLYKLLGGSGATSTLDGWREWLQAHNAAVMAVLFLVIGLKLVGSGLDGLLSS
jgi:hypothetical protein